MDNLTGALVDILGHFRNGSGRVGVIRFLTLLVFIV